MLRKNVKSLLEQLQVCIFAEIVFGVRCTLRIISRVFSKFSQNCSSRETKRAIRNTLKIQVKLILNCTRALAIACLAHTGQNFVRRTTFEVLPSRKQVCPLSLKNGLVVARKKLAIIARKKQQVQFIQNNFFTNKPSVI